MNSTEFTGLTLFDDLDDIGDSLDLSEEDEDTTTSAATREKVAIAKAYFVEYYYELIDYLGSVQKRKLQGLTPTPNELRTRRFTSKSVPPLFRFGKVASMGSNGSQKKKRLIHSSSMLVLDEYSSAPSSSSPLSPSGSYRRGETLKNINQILGQQPQKDPNKRKAYTMQFKASDKDLLQETKKLLAEKEQMNDIAAQVGKSLLDKLEEYEQQLTALHQKIEEDDKKISEYQSENVLWKEKYTILSEKVLVVESHNVRLEEQLEELHAKHKEEKEKVKPLLMRNRSLRSNLSDLELLKDEVASYQAAENQYKRQQEFLLKKNSDLEKEIERFQALLDSIGDQPTTVKANYKHKPVIESEVEGDIISELGVSFGEVVALLEKMLGKMSQMELDSYDCGNSLLVLDKAGKWIEYMQASAQPIIFQSIATKLADSGISIKPAQKGTQDYTDGSALPISTLLLTCLIALQICINSTTLYEQSGMEWKRQQHASDQNLQALRMRIGQLEGDLNLLNAQTEGLKLKLKHATEREEREKEKKRSMVHSGVSTEPILRMEKETNTHSAETSDKSTNMERNTQDCGVNTAHDDLTPATSVSTESDVAERSVGVQCDHADDTANSLVIHEETQEVVTLKKQVLSLKEELNKLSNIPSQRVTSVTSWEKNYHSELQKPILLYINGHLQGDQRLSHVLPANPERHIHRATYDGVLLCFLACLANPGILDERVINLVPTSDLEVIQNFALTINTAMAIGCTVPTTNPELFLADPHLMLEMLYQLVKSELYGKINIKQHPEFVRLRLESESSTKFRGVGPTELLQRWVNHHLSRSPPFNITSPLSEADFRALLSAILPGHSPDSEDWLASYAMQAGVQYPFLESNSIGNVPLQSLFLAQLAHAAPNLIPLSEAEQKRETENERDTDPQGTREERAFVMWINGLGIPMFVSNLQYDMSDGLALLHTLDKIERGVVSWKEVNVNPNNAYKKVENCNLGLKICASKLNFSLVGIGGKDIVDGNRKLILAVIWQACKYHLLAALRKCGDGVEVTESDVLHFLNKRIPQPITSFKDNSLRTALPLLDLLLHLAPDDVVKQANIRRRFPMSPEDCLLNAKYAIGLARKIFVVPSPSSVDPSNPNSHSPQDIPLCLPVLPEDIVEVNPKMLFIFVSMMMLVDKMKATSTPAKSQTLKT